MRKPGYRPGPTQTGAHASTEDDKRLEISDLGSRGIVRQSMTKSIPLNYFPIDSTKLILKSTTKNNFFRCLCCIDEIWPKFLCILKCKSYTLSNRKSFYTIG